MWLSRAGGILLIVAGFWLSATLRRTKTTEDRLRGGMERMR